MLWYFFLYDVSFFFPLIRGQLHDLWPNWPQLLKYHLCIWIIITSRLSSCLFLLGTYWDSIILTILCISVSNLLYSVNVVDWLLSFSLSSFLGRLVMLFLTSSARSTCLASVFWSRYTTACILLTSAASYCLVCPSS